MSQQQQDELHAQTSEHDGCETVTETKRHKKAEYNRLYTSIMQVLTFSCYKLLTDVRTRRFFFLHLANKYLHFLLSNYTDEFLKQSHIFKVN
jgi:hypothetical protein